MRAKNYISAILLLGFFLVFTNVSAQLITDSDRKLNSQPAKEKPARSGPAAPSKSPFAAFEKKKRIDSQTATSSRSNVQYYRKTETRSVSGERDHHTFFPESSTPRYSQSNPFKKGGLFTQTTVTPRYSTGSPFSDKEFNRTPKYSVSQVWSASDLTKNPRYSTGQIWSPKDLSRSPRYSSKQIWSSQDLSKSPRYSVGQVWSAQDLSKSPRYSVGQIWSYNETHKTPRYSVGQVWTAQDLSKSPRYSVPHIWSYDDTHKTPRYSVGQVWSTKDLSKSPRYSVGQVWSAQELNKAPRYSVGQVWSAQDVNKSPRYSVGQVWSSKDLNKSPRYSVNMDWSGSYQPASPRYSVGYAYEGYKFLNIPPRYSDTKDRFVVDKRYKQENRIVDVVTPYFTGNLKIDWDKDKEMHPSFRHHQATQSIEVVRESMRKWNIYWTRINGNKEDPKGVKENVSKPKFDRKEAKIWND